MSRNLFLLLLCCCLMGCVSKKKHLQYISSLKDTHEATLQQLTSKWKAELTSSQKSNENLKFLLAERKGENNILLQLRKELLDSIDQLEIMIDNLSQSSSTAQQNLNAVLQQKDQRIKQLQNSISQVEQALDRHVEQLEGLGGEIRYLLQNFDAEQYQVTTNEYEVRVALTEEILFVRGSVSRMLTSGRNLLGQIVEAISKHPNLAVAVIGHTDNSTPRRSSDIDNWNISVMRATVVVRSLIQDHNLFPSQLLAAGKAEFAPLASNETSDGRAKNRRIELIAAPKEDDLIKAIRDVIGE